MKAPIKTKSIRQTATFKASAKEVYEALMDEKKHAKFTRHPAKISRKVGGLFSAYRGYCLGVNLELVENKRIVQAWRGSDWPAEHLSTATFALAKAPGGGTKLTFTQTGVPEKEYQDIKDGWRDYYWAPMKKFLEG